MSSYQYGESHFRDKTVVRSSYLHNGISDTDKMASLYLNKSQFTKIFRFKISIQNKFIGTQENTYYIKLYKYQCTYGTW